MQTETNYTSKSYEGLYIANANEIPQLIKECLSSKVNLLIYGEPGCGKSSIIEGLAKTGEYNLVELGAASLCEEMINGIPVHDEATNSIKYDKPEWLVRIQSNHESEPEKPQILFIDELTLAAPEVAKSLQLLLTARAVPTHPSDYLPSNVVIVSATNTVEDTSEGGFELSRPLKTRFMSVRMTNTPNNYINYVLGIADSKLSDLKQALGESKFETFVTNTVSDFSENWCNDGQFYGVNPRTIMNFYKVCNFYAQENIELTPQVISKISERTVGEKIVTTEWHDGTITQKSNKKKEDYPTPEQIHAISEVGMLIELRNSIAYSTKSTSPKAIKAMLHITQRIKELEEENN